MALLPSYIQKASLVKKEVDDDSNTDAASSKSEILNPVLLESIMPRQNDHEKYLINFIDLSHCRIVWLNVFNEKKYKELN
jgi:hypothetical protein